MAEDEGGEAGGGRVVEILGGEEVQFHVVAGFFLNQGGDLGAAFDIPFFQALDERSDVNVAPAVLLAAYMGTKEISTANAGFAGKNANRLSGAMKNHINDDSHWMISPVRFKVSAAV